MEPGDVVDNDESTGAMMPLVPSMPDARNGLRNKDVRRNEATQDDIMGER